MTRRTETVTVKPSNNIYTALTGVAVVICLVALVLIWMQWGTLTEGDDVKLFFGLF